MSMIQDILITLRLIKIQMWKEQASIANGLKTHLFQKILDPYDFNPSQFEHDISSVCEMLKCPNSAESFIEKLSLSLKQHESMKM
jgi:lipoate synthase